MAWSAKHGAQAVLAANVWLRLKRKAPLLVSRSGTVAACLL